MQKLKNIKAAKQEQLVKSKGTPIRLSADFSTETMKARREWQYIFEVSNVKSLQAEILYTARLSFRRIKIFFRQAKTCLNRNIER